MDERKVISAILIITFCILNISHFSTLFPPMRWKWCCYARQSLGLGDAMFDSFTPHSCGFEYPRPNIYLGFLKSKCRLGVNKIITCLLYGGRYIIPPTLVHLKRVDISQAAERKTVKYSMRIIGIPTCCADISWWEKEKKHKSC